MFQYNRTRLDLPASRQCGCFDVGQQGACSHDSLGALCVRAEELVAPYYVFTEAGYDVTVASIKGGKIPVDPASLQGDFKTAEVTKFWADGLCCIVWLPYVTLQRVFTEQHFTARIADSKMKLLEESVALDAISGKEYDVMPLQPSCTPVS